MLRRAEVAMAKRTIVVLVLALGCGSRGPADNGGSPGDGSADADDEPFPCAWTVLNPGGARNLDLLFVIDNSASMTGEQLRLADQIGVLLRGLAERSSGFPNTHIGVVSTDLGSART
jgi:hypothetical protein